jgi:hypothetical protein
MGVQNDHPIDHPEVLCRATMTELMIMSTRTQLCEMKKTPPLVDNT